MSAALLTTLDLAHAVCLLWLHWSTVQIRKGWQA